MTKAALERRFELRWLAVWAGLLALIVALRYSPLGERLGSFQRFLDGAPGSELPDWSLPGFIVLNTALVAAGFPRLVFHALAGALFGFVAGFAASLAASVLGSCALVAFARWARPWRAAPDRAGLWQRLVETGERRPLLAVVIARQAPLSGAIVNLVLGWSRLPLRHVVLGTALGYVPAAAPAAFLGEGLRQASMERALLYLVPALAALVLAGALAAAFWRRPGRTQEPCA